MVGCPYVSSAAVTETGWGPSSGIGQYAWSAFLPYLYRENVYRVREARATSEPGTIKFDHHTDQLLTRVE